jgi:thioredoxin 1
LCQAHFSLPFAVSDFSFTVYIHAEPLLKSKVPTIQKEKAMPTIELTKENLESTILNNDTVIIDFWAEWCGPCKMFGPIFEEASNRHPDVVFAKVDTEKEQELAAYFQVRSIPMVVAFREQIGIFQQPGLLQGPQLDDVLGKIKALDMDQVRADIAKEEGN